MAKPVRKDSIWLATVRLFCIWLFIIILTACRTPVSEYPPRNPEEAAILPLLVKFQAARNARDLQRLLPLLHPGGQFTYACGVMVSKEALAAKLPEFWRGVDHEMLETVPLAHECLNGDYYTSGIFKDPEITVSGGSAQVKILFTRRWWRNLLFYIALTREGERWLITRTWWGPC